MVVAAALWSILAPNIIRFDSLGLLCLDKDWLSFEFTFAWAQPLRTVFLRKGVHGILGCQCWKTNRMVTCQMRIRHGTTPGESNRDSGASHNNDGSWVDNSTTDDIITILADVYRGLQLDKIVEQGNAPCGTLFGSQRTKYDSDEVDIGTMIRIE